jgi:hypothetical protein
LDNLTAARMFKIKELENDKRRTQEAEHVEK